MVLDGRTVREDGMLVTEPGRTPIPLQGDAAEEMQARLHQVRARLREYELKGNT
jgi:hypothetical protein